MSPDTYLVKSDEILGVPGGKKKMEYTRHRFGENTIKSGKLFDRKNNNKPKKSMGLYFFGGGEWGWGVGSGGGEWGWGVGVGSGLVVCHDLLSDKLIERYQTRSPEK